MSQSVVGLGWVGLGRVGLGWVDASGQVAAPLSTAPDSSASHPSMPHTRHPRPPPPTNQQDLTPRAKDSLVSFGERLSTRLFAAFLKARGIPAKQYDAYSIGVTTSDNFVNAEVRWGWNAV